MIYKTGNLFFARKVKQISFILLFILMCSPISLMAQTSKEIIYVGTYSQNNSEGIYVLEFDRENLTTTTVQTIHDKESPTFLALHPNKKFLYAAYREGKDAKDEAGTVIAYSIAPDTGKLTKINEVSSVGASPCHISVDPTGNVVFLSHYKGGNLSTFKILENGGVSEAASFIQHTGRSVHANQTTAHMHAMIPSKDGQWVYASDLGIDQILKYKVNKTNGTVDENPVIFQTSPGAGPRHFVFHPSLPYAYSLEELSNTVSVYSLDETNGDLSPIGRINMLNDKLHSDYNAGADIHFSKDAQWLYASNRGQDNLVVYKVDQNTGLLETQGHVPSGGKHPRNFKVDEKGDFVFVANMETDNLAIFNIDSTTGMLKATGKNIEIPRPVFIEQLFIE
ncbi:6-phosphogluconolactonase [Cyclobacterium amurskyense]|uniref:6-phosphogluconolactonase n=2 Tax=Cyclobacterium amurskyense TaxID=320787 RepID=A0A0H4PXI5_9BACT|nr:6-phosphogluconolactonase [Cyclobacterium amurskyense]